MKTIAKHLITLAIVGWVLISIMFVAGDPVESMTFGQFAVAKLMGCASIGAACIVGVGLHRKGWIINEEGDDDRW